MGKTNSKCIVNVTKPKGNRPDTTENTREGQHQHIEAKQTSQPAKRLQFAQQESPVGNACMFNLQIWLSNPMVRNALKMSESVNWIICCLKLWCRLLRTLLGNSSPLVALPLALGGFLSDPSPTYPCSPPLSVPTVSEPLQPHHLPSVADLSIARWL